MRSDLLSKRIFFAGCFGLPWLWVVHVLFHASNHEEDNEQQQGIVDADDRLPEESDQPSPEQIKLETEKWVHRCKLASAVAFLLFIAWIVTAQILRGSVLPHKLYFINQDNAEVTGW